MTQRWQLGVSWSLALAGITLAALAWLREPESAAEADPNPQLEFQAVPADQAPPSGGRESRLPSNEVFSALRICRQRLETADAKLRFCQRERGPSSPGPISDRVARCLQDQEVRSMLAGMLSEEFERERELERASRMAGLEKREALATAWMEENLGLTREQSRWLSEYVCAVRDMRSFAVPDAASPDGGADFSWEQLRSERERMLSNLRSFLGPQRYERLRAVGGIGLLADVLVCE